MSVDLDNLNTSEYDFPHEIWYILPQWEVGVKIGTFVPVILLGALGNVLLLNIIIRNRSLHTPTNLIIANMAAADLLTLTVCPTMFMIHDFYQNYEMGAFGCNMEGYLLGSLLVTAVLNLCVVSYDRLTAIVLPMETRLTPFGAKIVMAITWIIGFALTIPLAVYRNYRERQWQNFVETYCFENIQILPNYWHVLIAAMVWLPLTVMLICYSAIFWKLDRYEQQVLKREHPISVSYKTKVAKMLFIVVITFVILRGPFTALVFIRNQMLKETAVNSVDSSFQILWYTSHYLIFLNAAVNPIIYGLTNDNFRRAYKQTSLVCCSKPKPKLSLRQGNNQNYKQKRFYIGNMHPRDVNCDGNIKYIDSDNKLWMKFTFNGIETQDQTLATNVLNSTEVKTVTNTSIDSNANGGTTLLVETSTCITKTGNNPPSIIEENKLKSRGFI